MKPLKQLLELQFLVFVALFKASSVEEQTPYHPKTKNLKNSGLGYIQAKECLFSCLSLDLGSILIRSRYIGGHNGVGLHLAVNNTSLMRILHQQEATKQTMQ